MRFLFLALALSIHTPHVSAKIGEQYADYEKRLGPAEWKKTDGDTFIANHGKNGIGILVMGEKGVILREIYVNLELAEARTLLLNQYAASLLLADENAERVLWTTKDAAIMAKWLIRDKQLHVHDVAKSTEQFQGRINKILNVNKRVDGL